jgi:MULE transposase domain/Ulp1 protease family, C-terminal catalytic domain
MDNQCACGFVSKTANSLRSHVRTCAWKVSGGLCLDCNSGPFSNGEQLKTHKSACLRTCSVCARVFQRPFDKKRHEQSHTRASCDKCGKHFDSMDSLTTHILQCVVDATRGIEHHDFHDRGGMEKWIEEIQFQSKSYFSIHGGTKARRESNYSYRYCQHNQGRLATISLPTPRKTDRKRNFGLVPDYECRAKLSIVETDGKFKVKYFSLHNHACGDFKFQPQPKSLVKEIEMKINLGIPPKVICDAVDSSKWARENRTADLEINLIDHLSRRYVNQKRSKMRASNLLHEDDATSTFLLVDSLSKEKFNPVLLYKPVKKGVVFGDAKILSKHTNYEELFCLGIQTKEQKDKMAEFAPKILCGDATHGMTAYGYQLFSLVVKDDFGKGYTVASLIASHVDKLVLTHFFQLLQQQNPDMKITVTMSDDDEATKEAYKAGFSGQNQTNLLCQWHVPRAWQSKMARLIRKEDREEIMYLLKLCMRTRKKSEYDRIVGVILSGKKLDHVVKQPQVVPVPTTIVPKRLPVVVPVQPITVVQKHLPVVVPEQPITVVHKQLQVVVPVPIITKVSKFAFLPSAPKKRGQLYGNLAPSDNLSETLFEVRGLKAIHSITHVALKSLEWSPSQEDCQALDDHCQRLLARRFTPGWLNDTIIDAYLEISCRPHPKVQVLTCSEVLGMHQIRMNPVRPSKLAKSRLRIGVESLIMPYNLGNHWALLIYQVAKDEFLYIDSLSNDVPGIEAMDRIRECLEAWWNIHSRRGNLAVNISCTQQVNDYISCGIFVLHFAETCASGGSYLQPVNHEKFRLKVFQNIVKDPGNNVVS